MKDLVVINYFVPVLVAILLTLFFPATRHYPNRQEKQKYWVIVAATIVGAVLGAKLVSLMGEHFWPFRAMSWHDILFSGRSIVGALLGGHLAAEVVKPWLHYRMPPNNRLAAVIPFSIAIGRIGCWTAGCCRGLSHQGWWTVTYSDGISRYPIAGYEILFQLSVGIFFMVCVKKNILEGRLFSLYLMLYGLFRFAIEPLRATPKLAVDLSVYQILSIVMVLVGGYELSRRRLSLPHLFEKGCKGVG